MVGLTLGFGKTPQYRSPDPVPEFQGLGFRV